MSSSGLLGPLYPHTYVPRTEAYPYNSKLRASILKKKLLFYFRMCDVHLYVFILLHVSGTCVFVGEHVEMPEIDGGNPSQ